MSIKVGVRVRPFNKREQQLDSKCCVEMIEKTTRIIQKETGDSKTFVFDYSFWSHDKFLVNPEGVYEPVDEKYADQKKVYKEIGTQILTNAWEGYNCCLFAYGQTGSGKSYSMLGYGANKGIIPMVCDNIFDKINKDKDKTHSYEVKVSMMEIYNETLRDLLAKANKKKQQLKICESKKLGVYVEGLVKHSVYSYEEIQKKIQEGSNNRSIAATLMNQSSSRSHTIVSITFIQRQQVDISQTSIKYSTIHLVDLAGSQSVGKTGVDSKDRLREAAKINQSLSTLGRVIEILAQNSGKTDKQFVPYRDSKLTFILRNALGGNSRTVMICAISPADDNYQQTLSTLRYANRAKKIQNKATINESDVDKLIRMLREQNQMLKKMLKEAKFYRTGINMQMIEDVQDTNKNMVELGLIETEDQMTNDDNESTVNQNELSFNEASMSILDYNDKIDEKEPYITNLSEDELLSGRLKYSCAKVLTIGNKHGIPRPDVVLAALGILPLHCQIKSVEGKVFIEVCDQNASDYTFVNGENVHKDQPKQLMNFDRLIFGTGCIFLVKIPEGSLRQKSSKQIKQQDIDHAFAIAQMQQHHVSGGLNKVSQFEQQQIRKKVLEQIQTQYDRMKIQNEQKLRQKLVEQQKQYKQKIDEIQSLRAEQAERLKQQLQRQAKQALKLRTDKQKIQQQIVHFQQLQKKLQQSNIDKQALQQARSALEQKIATITTLQTNLLEIQTKEQQMRQQMKDKEVIIQRELELKMIICNNQNILNEYKLQLSKKTKNSQQLKQLLIKKERIELQKQLMQLVPMVEKFNLIAKQMGKNVESGLSIDYSYISQSEVLEILKSNSYKNKLKISIHVLNKQEKRSYFWNVGVFNNRYELALSMFQVFIRNQKDPQLQNKETDPYWDPPTPQLIGTTFLSLQPLFYKLQYEGDLSIVRKGDKIGKVHVQIHPTDIKKTVNISQQTINGISIHNPRDYVQKTLSFFIKFTNLKLQKEYRYSGIKLQYTLAQNSYKNQNQQSAIQLPQQFKYQNYHTLPDLSETIISHYVDQPLPLNFWGQLNQQDLDNLTSRDNDTEGDLSFLDVKSLASNSNSLKKSFGNTSSSGSSLKKSFGNSSTSGIIVSNFEVMSKIDEQFQKKKQEMKKKEQQKQKKQQKVNKGKNKDDCNIF